MNAWTVMLYLAGADDLEPYMAQALLALEEAGPPPGVEVIVQLFRAPGAAVERALAPGRRPTEIDGDWAGARRYRLRRRQAGASGDRFASELLADLGAAAGPADPKVLGNFVADALSRFPAERSLLLISGHGMGFCGITLDLVTGPQPATMTIRALAAALRRLERRPDILLLDACQMNSLDVITQFALPAPAAQVLIAPASHAPRAGLDYTVLLGALGGHSTTEAAALTAGALERAAGLQVLAFRLDVPAWRAVTRAARSADGPGYLPMYAEAARACIHPGAGQRLRLLVTWPNPVDFPARYHHLYQRLQFARRSGWGRMLQPTAGPSPARERLAPVTVPAPLLHAWLQILRRDLSPQQVALLLESLRWSGS
ncbi:MAG TPA: clostripain-related cysteine peptidase [Symbiobacteriaceae bacterium]|nr:clostripain-related cysteine peptidase [Symbiobacteriaceae bacterium]